MAAGCRPQELNDEQVPNPGQARLSAEAGVIEINYEMETSTRHQVVNERVKQSAALDAIYNAPTFSHSTVRMKIMADGSLESEVQFQESEQSRAFNKHKSLPDPSARIAKAVTRNGQFMLFDLTGKLVGSRQVPVQNFKAQMEEMKAAKSKAKANKSLVAKAMGQAGMDMDVMVEMAKAKNARIKDVGNAMKEIEMDMDEPAHNNGQEAKSLRVKHRLDMGRNVLKSSELIDRKTNKLLSRTTLLYKHDPQTKADNIQTVYSEEFAENPKTGRQEKRTTICQYKNFELINNLN